MANGRFPSSHFYALLACKASARPQVALQSKELWLFQFAFYGNYTKMLTNSR